MPFDLNTKSFLTGLAVAAKRVEVHGERALDRTGSAVADRAASLAPAESGELRASRYVVEGRDAEGYFVEVGFSADHAAANEFGTSAMPARPFLRPALAEAAVDFARRIV